MCTKLLRLHEAEAFKAKASASWFQKFKALASASASWFSKSFGSVVSKGQGFGLASWSQKVKTSFWCDWLKLSFTHVTNYCLLVLSLKMERVTLAFTGHSVALLAKSCFNIRSGMSNHCEYLTTNIVLISLPRKPWLFYLKFWFKCTLHQLIGLFESMHFSLQHRLTSKINFYFHSHLQGRKTPAGIRHP